MKLVVSAITDTFTRDSLLCSGYPRVPLLNKAEWPGLWGTHHHSLLNNSLEQNRVKCLPDAGKIQHVSLIASS